MKTAYNIRLGLSPFPSRQIPTSSKLDVELGVAESKMVNIKKTCDVTQRIIETPSSLKSIP